VSKIFQVCCHETVLKPSNCMRNITGGCGTFYAITITSSAFQGLSTLKQHRLVTEALKQEIEGIHGIQVVPIVLFAIFFF
jgi:stress-induced morphogen